MRCTDLLMQDHKVILRAMDVLDRMSERVQNDQPVAECDLDMLLRFLQVFADNYHQAKEESALFPELMRTAAADECNLRHMLFEHDQERSLAEGLEDALRTKRGKEFIHFAGRLSGLMRAHIDQEDKIVFEAANRFLSKEQDTRITSELNNYETEAGLFADLRTLELTYSSRAA